MAVDADAIHYSVSKAGLITGQTDNVDGGSVMN